MTSDFLTLWRCRDLRNYILGFNNGVRRADVNEDHIYTAKFSGDVEAVLRGDKGIPPVKLYRSHMLLATPHWRLWENWGDHSRRSLCYSVRKEFLSAPFGRFLWFDGLIKNRSDYPLMVRDAVKAGRADIAIFILEKFGCNTGINTRLLFDLIGPNKYSEMVAAGIMPAHVNGTSFEWSASLNNVITRGDIDQFRRMLGYGAGSHIAWHHILDGFRQGRIDMVQQLSQFAEEMLYYDVALKTPEIFELFVKTIPNFDDSYYASILARMMAGKITVPQFLLERYVRIKPAQFAISVRTVEDIKSVERWVDFTGLTIDCEMESITAECVRELHRRGCRFGKRAANYLGYDDPAVLFEIFSDDELLEMVKNKNLSPTIATNLAVVPTPNICRRIEQIFSAHPNAHMFSTGRLCIQYMQKWTLDRIKSLRKIEEFIQPDVWAQIIASLCRQPDGQTSEAILWILENCSVEYIYNSDEIMVLGYRKVLAHLHGHGMMTVQGSISQPIADDILYWYIWHYCYDANVIDLLLEARRFNLAEMIRATKWIPAGQLGALKYILHNG